jgi:hypothetical protein
MLNSVTLRGFSLVIALLPIPVLAQNLPPGEESSTPAQLSADASNAQAAGAIATPSAPVAIPAGTHIMMVLTSPLHTTSASAGSGLYLRTLYPIIQDNKIAIPAGTQIQGTVESSKRPGHFQRTAEFRFQFTTLIFPDNHVASIDGALQSIPGSRTTRTHSSNGTLRTVDQPEKVIAPVAAGGVTGAIFGSVEHFGIGKFVGAGLGAGLGLGGVLLRRGDEINLRSGTHVEMVLQSPLLVEQEQVAANQHVSPEMHRLEVLPNHAACSADEEPEGLQRQRSTPMQSRLPWPGRLALPGHNLW